jgi:hypothetical protein
MMPVEPHYLDPSVHILMRLGRSRSRGFFGLLKGGTVGSLQQSFRVGTAACAHLTTQPSKLCKAWDNLCG